MVNKNINKKTKLAIIAIKKKLVEAKKKEKLAHAKRNRCDAMENAAAKNSIKAEAEYGDAWDAVEDLKIALANTNKILLG